MDQRDKLGNLKKLLEPFVGVPMEYFKIHRPAVSDIEPSRLSSTLDIFEDGELLSIKLGRPMRSCEFKVKLFQFRMDSEAEVRISHDLVQSF